VPNLPLPHSHYFDKMPRRKKNRGNGANHSKNMQSNNHRNTRGASDLKAAPTTLNWNVVAEHEPGMRNLLSRDNKVHTFQQSSVQGNIITSNSAIASVFGKAWTSADIVQFSTFASVFDQYKIDFIECWFTPWGPGTAIAYNNNVRTYSVVDYDDANTGTLTTSAIQEYTNCVTTRCNEGHYIKFKPHQAKALYGGAFTQFGNEVAGWTDCGSTSTQFYGVKFLCEPTGSASDIKIDLFSRITVSFRNVF